MRTRLTIALAVIAPMAHADEHLPELTYRHLDLAYACVPIAGFDEYRRAREMALETMIGDGISEADARATVAHLVETISVIRYGTPAPGMAECAPLLDMPAAIVAARGR